MAAARSRFDPLKPERSEPRPDQPAGDVVKGAGRQLAGPDSDELVDLPSATAARQVYGPDDILSIVARPIKRVAEDNADVVQHQPTEPDLPPIDDSGVGPGRVDPIMEKVEFVYDKIAFVEIEDDFAEASSTVFHVDVSDESTKLLMDDDGLGFGG